MSNFNQYFKNTGAQLMIDSFFVGIDQYSDNKLTDLEWEIEDELKSASYYIENRETASFKVKLKYTINWDGEVRFSSFEVPKEIEGAFIIDGAYRLAINQLRKDQECRFYLPPQVGKRSIKFDYDRSYQLSNSTLVIRRTNPDLGLPEKVREYSLDEIGRVSGLEKEALRLTEHQSKKLQIKLDLDYSPEFITKDLIEKCINFGDDRLHDFIVDKKIESVAQGFRSYLLQGNKGRNLGSTKKRISEYWKKQGKLQEEEDGGIKTLTMLCKRYWKGSSNNSEGGSDLQINPGVNAINIQSISSKIQIPDSVAYNNSFSDLICIGDTPINQNVGKQNALTVSTHISEDGILFDVYDRNFTKVTIKYIDYLNKKVCASEFVDYENNTIKPNSDGKVEVKHHMKRKMVPVDEIELIDLHPDFRLSKTVRQIPFLNYSDSVRIHMGGSMLKQSIPLVNAERSLVSSGNSEEFIDNPLNEKFQYDEGKVKDITENEVIISLPNGEEVNVERRSAIQSIHDVAVYTQPKVKIGQKIKRGDIVTGAVGLDSDNYKSGINALVLFHAMFGLVNEDALVVSESFSSKMKSYSILDLSIDIKNNASLKEITPIGTEVKSGDNLATILIGRRLDGINRTLADKLGGITGPESANLTEFTIEDNLVVPNNITKATISDVLVQERTGSDIKPPGSKKAPDLTFTHLSKDVIDAYDMDRKEIYKEFPEYVASDRLKDVDLTDKSYKVIYHVRIRLIMETKLMVGSKLTNRYGGKGVISKVLPDNQMPVMVDPKGKKTTVEIVMNP